MMASSLRLAPIWATAFLRSASPAASSDAWTSFDRAGLNAPGEMLGSLAVWPSMKALKPSVAYSPFSEVLSSDNVAPSSATTLKEVSGSLGAMLIGT
jgi:hypothetical protein